MELEKTILRNLQFNDSFTRKVIPYLKAEYFNQSDDKLYFKLVKSHFEKYNKLPSKEEIGIAILDVRGEPEDVVKSSYEMAEAFDKEKTSSVVSQEWLIDQTEEFCQNRALYLAVMEVVDIIQKTGEDAKLMKTGTPDILNKALAVSFDSELGHNYLKDFDKRFDFYTRQVSTIPLHLKSFNEMLDGGVERKTLNLVVAQSGGGKSIWLCDIAAHYMMNGYNVLYFTLEMEEEKIGKRIDANLMDVNIKDFKKMAKIQYERFATQVKGKAKGELRIKVFPSSTTTTNQLRYLIKELEQKENFKPDVIIVDYIGIMVPSRKRRDGNMYDDGKQISVELRDLAKENNAVMWSACQFNSQGMNNTDADMQHVADSRAIIHNADFAFGLISSEELVKNGQVMVKTLKAREGDKDNMGKFMIGLDKTKMRFYELQNNGLQVSTPQKTSVATKKSVINNTTQPIAKPPTQGVKF